MNVILDSFHHLNWQFQHNRYLCVFKKKWFLAKVKKKFPSLATNRRKKKEKRKTQRWRYICIDQLERRKKINEAWPWTMNQFDWSNNNKMRCKIIILHFLLPSSLFTTTTTTTTNTAQNIKKKMMLPPPPPPPLQNAKKKTMRWWWDD